MRMGTTLLVTAGAVAVCIAVYLATDGRFLFFALPLLFALPLFGRRRS